MAELAERPSIPNATIVTLAILVIASVAVGWIVGANLPELHTILDTAMFVLSAMLALILWDMGSYNFDRPFKQHLAITFAAVSALELLHALTSVQWTGALAGVSRITHDLRPLTWPPPALVLPLGIGASLVLLRENVRSIWWFALALAVAASAIFFIFQGVAPYAPPDFLGITRPSLIPVPVLWGGVLWACWRMRDSDRALPTLGLMAATILLASLIMLYSRFPPDPMAIIAHLGRVAGYVALLFSLMHMASLDMIERIRAEANLARLNQDLDQRVQEQTARLRATNEQLAAEMAERRKSHELLQAVTENTPAVIYVKDLEGRYLMVNRRYCEIFHLKGTEVIGKTDYEFFSKEAADAFRAMDVRVANAGCAITEEEAAPQDDGLHTYISVKAPLRNENGAPYAVFGISTDITDLKRVQAALSEAEERARLIIETALDAVVGMDATGLVVDWSPQAVTTFGWTREEAIGRPLADLIIPERYRASHVEGLAHYLATNEARVLNQRIEISALHGDGREFPVELSITPIQTGGTVKFSAFARDITERKAAESRVEAQLQRMGLLDQITRAIGERQDIDSIFQVVVRTLEDQLPVDFACLCLYDAADNSLRVARVGVKSAPLALSLAMPERTRIEIDENGLSRCVRGALVYEPDIAQSKFPFPQRLARGGLHSFVAAPLQVESRVFGALIVARHQANGFSSGECEFLRQLSEHTALAAHQAQLYAALQEAYDELRQTQEAVMQQERLRALGQMASGIAHDINNALSPIGLYTESILTMDKDLSAASRGKLEIVQRAIDDAAHTVSRMKDFYRQRESEMVLAPVKTETLLRQVIDLTQARWRDMPQQRGLTIDLQTENEPDLPALLGIESELREALINLVFNAVDALPEGGTITMRAKRAGAASSDGQIAIEVADNGVGMDELTRQRCLEPFFTTKGDQGTGLGLAMVYGVVRRHGGDIEIESTPGEGTTLRLIFAAASGEATTAAPERIAAPSRRLRLLLVDDDPILLRSLRVVLEGEGHTIITAADGFEGVTAFEQAKDAGKRFDAVITDLGMPKMDGRRVAAAIKNLDVTMPVILLTGWGERLRAEEEQLPHIDNVLSKPPKLRDIRAALAQCCDARADTQTR